MKGADAERAHDNERREEKRYRNRRSTHTTSAALMRVRHKREVNPDAAAIHEAPWTFSSEPEFTAGKHRPPGMPFPPTPSLPPHACSGGPDSLTSSPALDEHVNKMIASSVHSNSPAIGSRMGASARHCISDLRNTVKWCPNHAVRLNALNRFLKSHAPSLSPWGCVRNTL